MHSLVAIMQARGWQSVSVKGTREFRQKIWHEATLAGIGVQGYKPGDTEIQQLQVALDRKPIARQDPHTSADRPATSSQPREFTGQATPPRDRRRPPVIGILFAHGAAPHRFDPRQRTSYHVTVRTETGEHTLWGSDLERAVAESRSGVEIGDEVVLSQRGARPVTVRAAEQHREGDQAVEKPMAQRISWSVETADHVATLERKAALFRGGHLAATAMLSQYPDLAAAVVVMKLAGQFAQRMTPDADTQGLLLEAIRTRMANAIAQGHEIRLPQRANPTPQTHPTPVRQRVRSNPVLEDPSYSRD